MRADDTWWIRQDAPAQTLYKRRDKNFIFRNNILYCRCINISYLPIKYIYTLQFRSNKSIQNWLHIHEYALFFSLAQWIITIPSCVPRRAAVRVPALLAVRGMRTLAVISIIWENLPSSIHMKPINNSVIHVKMLNILSSSCDDERLRRFHTCENRRTVGVYADLWIGLRTTDMHIYILYSFYIYIILSVKTYIYTHAKIFDTLRHRSPPFSVYYILL